MSDKSNVKQIITRLKNKIINSLHEVEIGKIIEVAKVLNIRINPEVEKLNKEKEQKPD